VNYEEIDVPPGRFELTEEDFGDLPVVDLSYLDELAPVQESIPMYPGRPTAADEDEPAPLSSFGIHNRKAARAAGLRNPKRKRGMAVPK
jgi:hypothetical protein